MQRQFLTAIAGAVVAWWIIERLKEMKAEKATVDPVAGLAASEANSEIMV